METITATEASNKLGALLDQARIEPVTIEKQGKEVAVMLSVEEYKRMEFELERASMSSIEQGLKDIKEGRVIGAEEAFNELTKRYQ